MVAGLLMTDKSALAGEVLVPGAHAPRMLNTSSSVILQLCLFENPEFPDV
jgi:hypothetical protein